MTSSQHIGMLEPADICVGHLVYAYNCMRFQQVMPTAKSRIFFNANLFPNNVTVPFKSALEALPQTEIQNVQPLVVDSL